MQRIGDSLKNKRVLITQDQDFMGPALCQVFQEHGATVISDANPLLSTEAVDNLVKQAGQVDILIANLAIPAPSTPVVDVTDEEWREVFAYMVDPLPRLFRAVLPQMIERQAGKIVVMGSASALRGMKRASTYSAARGAQVSYVQAAGIEVAQHNVQINLIAQNFVDNPTYFPPDIQANEKFQERLKREVPAGRLATPEEDALFAVFLASSEVNFFIGQSFAFSGGWAW
jgi:2-keto-3-deoxy-L-fuconate dehydrogenase